MFARQGSVPRAPIVQLSQEMCTLASSGVTWHRPRRRPVVGRSPNCSSASAIPQVRLRCQRNAHFHTVLVHKRPVVFPALKIHSDNVQFWLKKKKKKKSSNVERPHFPTGSHHFPNDYARSCIRGLLLNVRPEASAQHEPSAERLHKSKSKQEVSNFISKPLKAVSQKPR